MAEDTVETACTTLMKEKPLMKQGFFSELELVFKLIFDKKSFIKPLVIPSAAAPTNGRKLPEIDSLTIFSLGNLPKETKADKEIIKKLDDQSSQEMETIGKLVDQDSVAGCVLKAQELHWTPDELVELTLAQNAQLDTIRRQEAAASLKVAKAVRKAHRSWNIVRVNSWGEVLQNLRLHPVSGMILIAHSDSNGRLYDSQRDELPPGFFNAIPDQVGFVGVYSCDSDKVVPAYSLDHLKVKREVVSIEVGSPLNQTDSTPLELLPTWVSEASKDGLFDVASGSASGSVAPEAECSMEIENLNLQDGRLAVTIAGLPVGVWSAGSDNQNNLWQAQLLPCSWLSDPSKVSVFIQPSSTTTSFNGKPDFSIRIDDGKSAYSLSSAELFSTSSGAFRSALISKSAN
jgi:hypothetical protein